MKFRITIVVVMLLAIVYSGFTQTKVGYRQPANVKAIPEIVRSSFKIQYPDALVQGWFVTHITYWQNDYSSAWYYDWYGNRTVVVYTFEKPTYYEVEFINNPGELSRAIYNYYGYWYETRSQIHGLPKVVADALKTSQYANWKISPLKERIENPAWPVDIYRFQVSKGIKSRIIRMDDDGNIIQARFLNE